MPVYEYACTDCGERLEVRQSFTDDPLTECPACSGRLRKVLSAVGVVFKGSGFYRTDSRAAANGAKEGAAASKSSGESGGGKTSTPAAASSSGDSKPSTSSDSSSGSSTSTAKASS